MSKLWKFSRRLERWLNWLAKSLRPFIVTRIISPRRQMSASYSAMTAFSKGCPTVWCYWTARILFSGAMADYVSGAVEKQSSAKTSIVFWAARRSWALIFAPSTLPCPRRSQALRCCGAKTTAIFAFMRRRFWKLARRCPKILSSRYTTLVQKFCSNKNWRQSIRPVSSWPT